MQPKLNRILFGSALVITLVIPRVTRAQEVTGAITGLVSDPSGAAISNATITARETNRGTVLTTRTNAEGFYTLPRVPTGRYEVRAEAPGFQTSVRPEFQLELNQNARVDFPMVVGQITETINVESAPPLLQTENTQLGTVINARTNVNLPLATRNYVQLTLLAPGAVNPNPQTLTTPQTPAGAGRPYINGNREQANNFLLDGMDNNQVSDNLVGYTPSVDAIQEFNMITNNASAEFGNFQGGIINAQIKSGTNEFHGTVFYFFRNDKLNANEWSNNWSGAGRPALRWNMFGAGAGGPIKRDKLFFFADYQGQRFNRPASVQTASVFTAAERTGDFSELLRQPNPIQLYDPLNLDAQGRRVPFPNNQIPIGRINVVARNLFASDLYPSPANANLTNNFFYTSRSATNVNQGDVKIDYNVSEKDRLFVRYSQSFLDAPNTNSSPLFFGGFNEAPTYNGVLNWTRVFSPAIVNEFRFGGNYVEVRTGTAVGDVGNFAEQLGIANGNDVGPGLLALNMSGGFVSGIGSSNVEQLFPSTVYQLQDNVIITKGKHVLHTGFLFQRRIINPYYSGNNGRWGFMSFTGRFTAGPAPLSVAGSGSGAGEADFFLGLPETFGRGVGSTEPWKQRSNIIAGYIQDDFRITPTLTLNLGLRYELNTPWVEGDDRQTNFHPFTGEVQFPDQPNIYDNRGLYHTYNGIMNWQPRVGFAWSPEALGRKTVFRGAYTLSSYLEGTGTNLRLTMNPPFMPPEFQTQYTNVPLPATRTEQGLLPPQGSVFDNALIRLWDPYIRPAAVQQWNFTIQQQFDNSTTLQAGYVGQKGTHLAVPMPYLQSRLLPDGTTEPSQYLSGNPELANISQISGTEANGTQRYDALQATLQKRYSAGLQAQVAYTWSKCMTNSSGYYGSWGGQATPTSPYWQNLYDSRAEWGPCYYDVTHTLTSYATYELPFGRGRAIGANWNPVANAIAGGWQLGGIVSWHTGFPLTISAGDASGTNSRGARANCIAPPVEFGKRNHPLGGFQWFDPNSYAAPAPRSFGTCGVGTVRGPGLTTFDLSLQKQFQFTEDQRLEFRTEFINSTNTPILNSPSTGLGGELGRVGSSQGARNIQFALKYYF
jgi:hypothetical protein